MLKVAILSHLYPSTPSPTHGYFVHEHVRALRELGVDARTIAPVPRVPRLLRAWRRKWMTYDAIARDTDSFEGVPVVRPDYFTPPSPLHFAGAWTMATRLAGNWPNFWPDFRCDLIHAHNVTPDGFAALRLRRRVGTPVVCSSRGSDLHTVPKESRIFRALTRSTLNRLDGLITVSRALARDALALAPGIPAPRVIYNGVAPAFQHLPAKADARRRLGLPSDARVVLNVGRCERDKGLGELLAAFASLPDPTTRLVLVGDGSARSAFETETRERRISDRVTFAGPANRARIPEFLAAADVFALPSYGEGMPNALLEAMAAHLPCVATAVGGIPEALDDQVSGLLVPPRSADALGTALRRLLDQPEFGQRLGDAAARAVASRFSWEANARQHLAFYREILARSPRHP